MAKLLFINTTCNHGSTGKISEQLGLLMVERGWDVYCACGERFFNSSKLKVIKFSSTFGIYFHKLISLIFDSEGKCSIIATKRLVAQIKKINPDVIHLHNIHGHYINYRILFAYLKESGKPVIWTFHDCWPMTGHCAHFVRENCEKWKTGCYCCPLKNDYPSSWLLDRSRHNWLEKKIIFASLDDMVIVPVSHWLCSVVQNSYLNTNPSNVIHNGVDLNVFKPNTQKQVNHKFTVLGVAGVWTEDKGLGDFIRLSKILCDDIQLVLAGISNRQALNFEGNITPIPFINSQHELAELYNSADVILSLSRAETFGMTIAEAFACGKPVIAYDNTAQSELITAEVGILVQTGDVNAVNNAIAKIKDNPISPETCRRYAEEHFDKDKCFSEYVKLYESFV